MHDNGKQEGQYGKLQIFAQLVSQRLKKSETEEWEGKLFRTALSMKKFLC